MVVDSNGDVDDQKRLAGNVWNSQGSTECRNEDYIIRILKYGSDVYAYICTGRILVSNCILCMHSPFNHNYDSTD